MVNSQLAEYIRKQLNSGYDTNTIRNYLIRNGYNENDVNDAINSLSGSGSSSKKLVIIVALIGILLAFLIPTIYYYSSQETQTDELIELKTSLISQNIVPGATVSFNVDLNNLGKIKTYQVTLTHELLGTQISKKETTTLQTKKSITSSLDLPSSLSTGTYTIKTTAEYNGKKAYSTFTFGINIADSNLPSCSENWECSAWLPEQCTSSGKQTRTCIDKNSCGTTNNKPDILRYCQPDESDNKQGTSSSTTQTVWEKLDSIEEEAKTDPDNAKKECPKFEIDSHKDECYLRVASVALDYNICSEIISDRTKDKCYNNIAKLSNDNSICEQITTQSRKDSCYMNFVNKGDYTVCEKIDNSYLREACTALRDMPEVVVT